jgi:hypothetical protein
MNSNKTENTVTLIMSREDAVKLSLLLDAAQKFHEHEAHVFRFSQSTANSHEDRAKMAERFSRLVGRFLDGRRKYCRLTGED